MYMNKKNPLPSRYFPQKYYIKLLSPYKNRYTIYKQLHYKYNCTAPNPWFTPNPGCTAPNSGCAPHPLTWNGT